jgi:hypothetical protein
MKAKISVLEFKASLITVKKKKQDESQVDREIFKNIQPISVGV